MIKTTFPTKDATIYNDIKNLNTGLDEILELRSSKYSVQKGTIAETEISGSSLSRILMKFDLAAISSSMASGTITNPRFYLKLNTARAERLALDYTINSHPISQSWDMGSGKKASNPIIENGVSWNFKISGSAWSGSVSTPVGGATWYTQSAYSASQVFSYEDTDLEMNVTNIVNACVSGTLPNEGFILKFTNSLETSGTEYGFLNFFSKDTHTIYPPTLQVRWDDSSYSTGSMSAADINDFSVSVSGLKERYKNDEKPKISLFVRDKFPTKSYVTSSRHLTGKYLPSSSYYAVKDAHTEEFLIPFDTGSNKISCNSSGHFFNFDMTGLQPE